MPKLGRNPFARGKDKKKVRGKPKIPMGYISAFAFVVGLVGIPMSLLFIISFLVVFLVPSFGIPVDMSGTYTFAITILVVVVISTIYYLLFVKSKEVQWGRYGGG